MEMLELYRRGTLLARVALAGRPIEIGRARGADLVVDDPELCDHHFLVVQRGGATLVYDVSRGKRAVARPRRLPRGEPLSLCQDYSLMRTRERPALARDTDALRAPLSGGARLWLVVGSGAEARRVALGERPLHVGRADDNDLVLADRAVSQRHFRLEPCAAGLLLRDLGSSNGTYVHGVRVDRATLGAGALLRVGHTDLRVVEGEPPPSLVAVSPRMLDLLSEARRVARLSWPVLVVGESGSGKEGVARLLHEESPRAERPFVAMNAGALPRELVESELFGHERGAFTGAASVHRGVFEQADRGTLFIDEIGELPAAAQARLLRVLETGELRRVGAECALSVDVRVVCATHRDLPALAESGGFRQDLLYRLARLSLQVPSLRSRPEDVEALSRHFLSQMAPELGGRELTEEALARLVAHDWPGNVRELRNVLSTAAVRTAGPQLERADVERALQSVIGHPAQARLDPAGLRSVVQAHGGNRAAAARALGIPRSTLRDRLRSGDYGS